MLKILYLCETLKVGGAEELLLTTLRYLNCDRFYPVVYCIGEQGKIGEEIEKIGIRIQALNKRPALWKMGILWNLMWILKKEKPNILHTHLFYANYFGRIAGIFARVPVIIITEHGTHSNFKKIYHHWIDFVLALFTSKVIAVSLAVKEYLLKYTMIPKQRIAIIYNAIDFERFDNAFYKDKDLLRAKLGFENHSFLIGCVSNLTPWKGQLVLLQAFNSVIKHFPNAKLCIVGRDAVNFQSKLELFAKKENLQRSICFLGERRDTPEILKAFDIFIFPSLTEGLGISLLEAMYMGLPAIASKVEGILEIIENNKSGILVPAGDYKLLASEILMLLENKDKMQMLGENARKRIEKYFSPKAYIEELELLYNAS